MSEPAPISAVRVAFSSMEDARRLIFLNLDGLDDRKRSRLASRLAATLRDAGLLGASIEQHYSAGQLAALLGRSSAWVVKWARRGAFGRVFFDSGNWLIPASGVQEYLSRNEWTAATSSTATQKDLAA